jgi:hypothetical protein
MATLDAVQVADRLLEAVNVTHAAISTRSRTVMGLLTDFGRSVNFRWIIVPTGWSSEAARISLVGPPGRIGDRLAPWRESSVTTIICGLRPPEAMRTLAEAGS